jgi:hypothetical protein
MSRLADETGKPSLSRVLCSLALGFTGAVIVADLAGTAVGEAIYVILTSLNLALIGWAAGPRIAQYLLPQLGAATSAVATAIVKRRDKASGTEPT